MTGVTGVTWEFVVHQCEFTEQYDPISYAFCKRSATDWAIRLTGSNIG
jgi:hypothetical protein